MSPLVAVIIPAHNPDPERLRRTLAGLNAQTFPAANWETLLVDNASTRFPGADFFAAHAPARFSIVAEPVLGLTAARRRGFQSAAAPLAVLVDDDNVLAPDYLAHAVAHFTAHPALGTAGGRSLPEFTSAPADWTREFFPLLALRDLGESPILAESLRPLGTARDEYPLCAPIGAGLVVSRAAWTTWTNRTAPSAHLTDRRGGELTSGGDNDLVLCALRAGHACGYFPDLSLTHLIPDSRLTPDYLARLNRGIQHSWMQVLTLHAVNPWPPLSSHAARLRQLKAWFTYRAWNSTTPAPYIRWQGACGHFSGRVPC